MTRRITSLISGLVLACGLAAFTGSALAGNGHGNGQDKSPSASAGQGNANGQDKSTSASAGQAMLDQNTGPEQGVKPDSSTAKGNKPTMCSTGGGAGSSATCTSSGSNAATAQTAGKSDQSKKYGNGKTAAQIANSRGAPAGAQVYGPGNSQPHKVWDCKRHHWVDVHAVKSYSTTSCSSETAATTGKTGSSPGTTSGSTSSASTSNASSSSSVSASSNSSHNSNATAGTATGRASGSTPSAGPASSAPQSTAAGGVLGVTASGGSSAPAGGVLGAIASAGSGVLPFTGLSLSLAVLVATLLLAAGFALRRHGRAAV